MSDIAHILSKISEGAIVRIVRDAAVAKGREQVEVVASWALFTRRYDVTREEMARVKAALAARDPSGSRPGVVTIAEERKT